MSKIPLHEEVSTPKHFLAVTASDTVDEGYAGGLYIGGSGDVKFTTIDDTDITLTFANDETWFPITVKRVWSTGTTATNIYLYF